MNIKRQRGLSLLETSIALALMALGVIATLQMRVAQSRVDSARAVGQLYERLNNAAGSYMTLFYEQILKKDLPECGVLPYRVGASVSVPELPAGDACKIALASNGNLVEVANYLQPKPSELKALGLLAGSAEAYDNTLPLLTYMEAGRDSSLVTYRADGTVAPNGFAVLIQLVCVGNSLLSEPVLTQGGCGTKRYDLRSLVFNLQPYVADGPSAGILYQLVDAAGGGRTYLSDGRYEGRLKDNSGGPAESGLSNPLKMADDPGRGAPYVVAIRNGYGSAGDDAFVRRDGSTPLTGNWDVGNRDITGISAASATVIRASSYGIFGNVTDSLTEALRATTAYIRDSLRVAGTLTVSGVTSLLGNLSVAGTTSLLGNLSVSGATSLLGNLSVSGAADLLGNTSVNNLRLMKTASLGDSCTPGIETLAQQASSADSLFKDEQLRLLVCDTKDKVWVRAQRDLYADLNALSSAFNTFKDKVVDELGKDVIATTTIKWVKATARPTNYVPPTEFRVAGLLDTDFDYIYIQTDERMWRNTGWLCPSAALERPVHGHQQIQLQAPMVGYSINSITQSVIVTNNYAELLDALNSYNVGRSSYAKFWRLPLDRNGDYITGTAYFPDPNATLLKDYYATLDYFKKKQLYPESVGNFGSATLTVPVPTSALPAGYAYDVACITSNFDNSRYWYVAVTQTNRSRDYGNDCQRGFSSRITTNDKVPWGGGVKWDYFDRFYFTTTCQYANTLTRNWLSEDVTVQFQVVTKREKFN